MFTTDILQYTCHNCGEVAQEPFIECCECETNLCTSCFASGREVNGHRNNHQYAIRRNDFPLFENCNWSAKEECKLLQAISTHGYGNWEEIAKTVHTRSKLECQEHYKKYYIENVQHKELELLPPTLQSVFPQPVIPYLFSTNVSREPPRNNRADQHLAGYNAQRSEFELSFDNHAESIFSIENTCSDEEMDECMESLQVALFKVFNNRLRERHRRYKIIKQHGLIMPNKLISWLHKIDIPAVRQNAERLLPFMQFMTGMQFDSFIQTVYLENSLKNQITRLYEYRENGITTMYGGRLYKALKPDNDLMIQEQRHVTSLMGKEFQTGLKSWLNGVGKKKRLPQPLDIVDLPDFSLLLDKEKELCSNVRLLPQIFLEIKRILIAENDKLGYLKLLDARKMAKIDVNKTRRIYDYLLTEGFIKKP